MEKVYQSVEVSDILIRHYRTMKAIHEQGEKKLETMLRQIQEICDHPMQEKRSTCIFCEKVLVTLKGV
jgi:hypothetical protein